MKSKRGITLVALVITIIILLILAGITIAQLTGSGLFENTRLAEEKSKEAQEKENKTLSDYENKIDEYVDGTRETNKSINMDTVYLGSADSLATYNFTFPKGKELSDYKYLIFYANAVDTFSNQNRVEGKSEIIPAEVTSGKANYDISHWTKWYIMFSIPNKDYFRIDAKGSSYSPCIYRIDAIY